MEERKSCRVLVLGVGGRTHKHQKFTHFLSSLSPSFQLFFWEKTNLNFISLFLDRRIFESNPLTTVLYFLDFEEYWRVRRDLNSFLSKDDVNPRIFETRWEYLVSVGIIFIRENSILRISLPPPIFLRTKNCKYIYCSFRSFLTNIF